MLRTTDEGTMEGERGNKRSALDSIPRGFLVANKYKALLISSVFKYDRKYSPGQQHTLSFNPTEESI